MPNLSLVTPADGEVWYIPLWSVSSQKIFQDYSSFDCSAKFENVSLNDHILQGPDVMNSVLHGFRKGKIAVMCDIQRMIHV